ncbi:uncharacterized protein LOC115927764 [Strongylocentrotus purpuratus]|uniref:C2H2-type domain-containing protein n=1 Tax=Strongylocentrotus purpuratus TaxID=7668 RepID=A0A7M7PG81_STRPU|nr:uncharacterized protein LOC115927764 [Strongylocentrotus purpuratus]
MGEDAQPTNQDMDTVMLEAELTNESADTMTPKAGLTNENEDPVILVSEMTNQSANSMTPKAGLTNENADPVLLVSEMTNQSADTMTPEAGLTNENADTIILVSEMTNQSADTMIPEDQPQTNAEPRSSSLEVQEIPDSDSSVKIIETAASSTTPRKETPVKIAVKTPDSPKQICHYCWREFRTERQNRAHEKSHGR